MQKILPIIFIALLCTEAVYCSWEFAVTTKSKILLYDDQWQPVGTAAHQFAALSAITLDEMDEVLYFNDREHNESSIFSVKIPTDHDEPHYTEHIVQRTKDEHVAGIAYDPVDRQIFWTDKQQRRIYAQSVDQAADKADNSASEPRVLIEFPDSALVRPDGLAIDVCRRRLYYTNSHLRNATVERINLDGSNRTVVVRGDLFQPHGIAVDQLLDRIYWVVDQQGIYYTVESATLDGEDREVLVRGTYNTPYSLTVTKEAIFWTDVTNKIIWSHAKRRSAGDADAVTAVPRNVTQLDDQPNGIVGRAHFLATLGNDAHCAPVVREMMQRLLAPRTTRNPNDVRVDRLMRSYCLNGGSYSEQSEVCICPIGFRGQRCETSECHNYCVHGSCTMSEQGYARCTCQTGFGGDRCETHRCKGYCLNGGVCSVAALTGEPECECHGFYGGERCEKNNTEVCALFCRLRKLDPEVVAPFGCYDICSNLRETSADGSETYALPSYEHLQQCSNPGFGNTTIIVIVVGVVVSLCLVVVLMNGVRRFYKPQRPRIKKTFVVRKHAAASASSDTPLTNRPMATEQCEITIENCCNMNICDTPCFDPKLVQQSFGSSMKETKEDKKVLIHNMEDELY